MVLETHHPAAVYSNWCTGSASRISWPMKMMGPSGTVSKWVCQCTAPPPGSIMRWLRSFLCSDWLEEPSAESEVLSLVLLLLLLLLLLLVSEVLIPVALRFAAFSPSLLPLLLPETDFVVVDVSSHAATGKGLAFKALRCSTLK